MVFFRGPSQLDFSELCSDKFHIYKQGFATSLNYTTQDLHHQKKNVIFVPRCNEVAEGGYCIALRPSVRPSDLNNLKSFSRNLMPSHTGL